MRVYLQPNPTTKTGKRRKMSDKRADWDKAEPQHYFQLAPQMISSEDGHLSCPDRGGRFFETETSPTSQWMQQKIFRFTFIIEMLPDLKITSESWQDWNIFTTYALKYIYKKSLFFQATRDNSIRIPLTGKACLLPCKLPSRCCDFAVMLIYFAIYR